MNFRTLAGLCAAAFTITGCTIERGETSGGISNVMGAIADTSSESESAPVAEKIDTEQITCKADFSDGKITVEGQNASVSGNTLSINGAGVFQLTGKSADAKIVINAADNDEIALVLNNVDLTSKSGAVIDCENAKLLQIVSASGTKNTLTDSENYTFAANEDEPDAAVFSRCDTIYTAENGSLTINGNYKDALKCKDGLSIEGGTLEINSSDDGIMGKDYVLISSGNIAVNAGGDGIKSTHDTDEKRGYVTIDNGEITINCANDGIQAETSLTVNGGKITIKSGGDAADAEISPSRDFLDFDNREKFHPTDFGGAFPEKPSDFTRPEKPDNLQNQSAEAQTTSDSESMKGLKAGKNLTINGGEISVTAADDSVHSNGDISVKDGSLSLSSCDDGVHADETLIIEGGKITISKSYEALEGKNIEISGGEINLTAADDGINAAGGDNGAALGFNPDSENYYLSISGGNITINAEGDGLDSNGTVALSGGYVTVYGPTNGGNGAIDYQKSFAVSGGEMIALGGAQMAQAPSTLSQPCLSIFSNVSANSKIEVRGSAGNVIMSTTTPKSCGSLIFTSDKLKSGESYTIYANDTLLSTVTATEGVSGGGASANSGMGGNNPQRPNGFKRPDRNQFTS